MTNEKQAEREAFEAWWAGSMYGQILALTGDTDADATSRIAKVAAWDAYSAALAQQPQAAPSASAQQAEPEKVSRRVHLSAAQLLEALEFVAPDRDTDQDQLDGEVTIEHGEGHSGTGYYCYVSDYPEEGAILLDGESASSIIAAPAPSASPAQEMVPLRIEYEPGYPEDVAFGSQRQMDRLKKWLDNFFAMRTAQSASPQRCVTCGGAKVDADPLRTGTCDCPAPASPAALTDEQIDGYWESTLRTDRLAHQKFARAILNAGSVQVRTEGFRDCIDAIKGAIAFGQRDTNPAPDGHWLAEFWEIGRRLAASPADQVEDAHPDDAAVNRFAAAMKAKMAASRVKGRAGWDDPEQCAPEFLASMLIDHLHKGDPVDVGNFAMMLFNRPDARGVLAQVWATRYGQDAASPAKCDGTVSNCPNECSAPCSPSELPAMTDAQIETMLRVREHEPTIFIEDEILSNYDEMREEVWEAIKSYADIHARAALQQCRALLATEKKCTRCEYIGHCDCEVMESK